MKFPELIAQGKNAGDRWRIGVPPGKAVLLGRETSLYRVPWDPKISREHLQLTAVDEVLQVKKLATATNPVFYNGKSALQFTLQPGEHFVIGSTTFTLSAESALATLDVPNPIQQRTFTAEFLNQLPFHDAEKRIEVLNRLPDLIASAGDEDELLNRLARILLDGISLATTVAFVKLQEHSEGEQEIDPERNIDIVMWDHRANQTGDFHPSEKLIRQALDLRQTVLHQWQTENADADQYTYDLSNDWAFVTPVIGAATKGWGIYITGRRRGSIPSFQKQVDSQAEGDVKFTQLIATLVSNLFQVKQLERRQASLRSFFSPIVLEVLRGRDPDEVLIPQKSTVSVMFCDLRGFSRQSESLGDELFQLLQRVSSSLDVMTGEILNQGGVIGDFHGDAAMGFWGWPLPQTDRATRAIDAAIAIDAGFRQLENDENLDGTKGTGFKVAIGIASGVAVAGKIGSRDQVKVTAFGPVVNLAARLEGLNRFFNSAILTDRKTMEEVVGSTRVQFGRLPQNDCLYRNLGSFRPYGMNSVFEIFQIMTDPDLVSEHELPIFHAALQEFRAGHWQECLESLKSISASDNGRKFLEEFIRQHPSCDAPANWQGTVEIKSK